MNGKMTMKETKKIFLYIFPQTNIIEKEKKNYIVLIIEFYLLQKQEVGKRINIQKMHKKIIYLKKKNF